MSKKSRTSSGEVADRKECMPQLGPLRSVYDVMKLANDIFIILRDNMNKYVISAKFCLFIKQITINLRKRKTLIMLFTFQFIVLIEKLRRGDIFTADNIIIYSNPTGVI